VHIKDEATNTISEPQRTREILGRMDLRLWSLEVLAMPKPKPEEGEVAVDKSKRRREEAEGQEEEEEGEAGLLAEEGEGEQEQEESTGLEFPVCRIVDRQAALEAQRAKEKEERKAKSSTKELEINWATAPHDLGTKARQLKQFLEKGLTVHLLLMRQLKKGKRQASKEEAEQVLQATREAALSVPGTTETKAMQGKVGEQVRMVFTGPTPKKVRAPSPAAEAASS